MANKPIPEPSAELYRRDWLKLIAGSAGGLFLFRTGIGCGYFPADSGPAFAPWDFPGAETVPERIAARAALLAANPHNSQPWMLHITPTQIDLHADFTRNLGSIDSLLREMHIGLGCALENLVIAAQSSGRTTTVTLLPDATDPSLVATISLATATPTNDPLFAVIANRHTNRGRYAESPPAAGLEAALQALVTEPNVQLNLLTSTADMASFRTGTVAATVAFIADAQMSEDSNSWYRQSAADILQHRDGITIDTSGNGSMTRVLGKILGTPSDSTSNSYWLSGTQGDQSTASAFAILSSPATSTHTDQLSVGRVYQRINLWAVTQGLATQPLNQLAEMQDREETQGHTPQFTNLLSGLLGDPNRRGQMLFRIGVPWNDALESPRRPLEWMSS